MGKPQNNECFRKEDISLFNVLQFLTVHADIFNVISGPEDIKLKLMATETHSQPKKAVKLQIFLAQENKNKKASMCSFFVGLCKELKIA